MPENPPLTAADYARIDRLLNEYDIDADDRDHLERLVLAMEDRRDANPARRKAGRKYGRVVEDFVILEFVGIHLAKQKERGVARPSIRRAAMSLAKNKTLPFIVWGMSAETIRQRHSNMRKRLCRGEALRPELQNLIEWLAERGHRVQQAQ